MTPQEREDKWARWPQGDAGDAIDFACGHIADASDAIDFLDNWRADFALHQYPDYLRWLTVQRDGARAASGTPTRRAEKEVRK